MQFILDIYFGSGVQPSPDETITAASTRDGIRRCREKAQSLWGTAKRCYPADDDVASFGPSDDDEPYVTLRRVDKYTWQRTGGKSS